MKDIAVKILMKIRIFRLQKRPKIRFDRAHKVMMHNMVVVIATKRLIIVKNILCDINIYHGKKLYMINASDKNRTENTIKNIVAPKNFINIRCLIVIDSRFIYLIILSQDVYTKEKQDL